MIVVYAYNAASHSLRVALHSGSDVFWMVIYLQYCIYLIYSKHITYTVYSIYIQYIHILYVVFPHSSRTFFSPTSSRYSFTVYIQYISTVYIQYTVRLRARWRCSKIVTHHLNFVNSTSVMYTVCTVYIQYIQYMYSTYGALWGSSDVDLAMWIKLSSQHSILDWCIKSLNRFRTLQRPSGKSSSWLMQYKTNCLSWNSKYWTLALDRATEPLRIWS